MDENYPEQVSVTRRKLQNPYACVEELELDSPVYTASISTEKVESKSRSFEKLSENPYAFAPDDDEDFATSAAAANKNTVAGSERSRAKTNLVSPVSERNRPQRQRLASGEIEAAVKATLRMVWKSRAYSSGWKIGQNPAALLDPEFALGLIGYDCEIVEGLGQFRHDQKLIEVAGLIDTNARIVRVSRQFPPCTRRFTLAHELGHAALHGNLGIIHRDKPLEHGGSSRIAIEREADQFASLFLMPERLVRRHFFERFLCRQFVISEDALFALGQDVAKQLQFDQSRRSVARLLAGIRHFNGNHFPSLAETFGVSTSAMAIRIEELMLLVD